MVTLSKEYIYSIYIESHECIQSTGRKPSRPEPPVTVHLFTPEESHSFTNPYVVVIEVAETRKGDRGQNEEGCSGQLDFRLSVNVVSHNLAQSPEREMPHSQLRPITNPFLVILNCKHPKPNTPLGGEKSADTRWSQPYVVPPPRGRQTSSLYGAALHSSFTGTNTSGYRVKISLIMILTLTTELIGERPSEYTTMLQ